MSESGRFFEGTSGLHHALRDLSKELDRLEIPYVVIGGLALTAHGYARMTEDIDILIAKDDLKKLHASLVGRGYLPAFQGSKHLRDTSRGVKIEFVYVGDYPGSGERQAIAFPSPATTEPLELDGVRYIGLKKLVELKLASAMTGGPPRAKDRVDVQQLIQLKGLPADFSSHLDPYVRREYDELFAGLHAKPTKYIRIWRNKFLTVDATSIDDMVARLEGAAAELRAMKADGVQLDPDGGIGDDYAQFYTNDRVVAEKHDMHDEAEFFGDDE